MSVLHPWVLALVALAAVPLLLHLVRRETRRRVPFPALRYLQSAERLNARSMRIRDWLLALVRVAVVVLLAAAASRPLIGRGEAASHPPTDLILVLDNTASMNRLTGDSSLLDAARAAASLTLERMGPEDRIWLASKSAREKARKASFLKSQDRRLTNKRPRRPIRASRVVRFRPAVGPGAATVATLPSSAPSWRRSELARPQIASASRAAKE